MIELIVSRSFDWILLGLNEADGDNPHSEKKDILMCFHVRACFEKSNKRAPELLNQ